jgi:hypothetical protein
MSGSVPTNLINAVNNGECSIFVGAGLSIGAGLPSWNGLAKLIANQIGFEWPNDDNVTSDTLLSIAQYYENAYGRNSLIRYLQVQLDDTTKHPTDVHSVLTSIPVYEIFTTNYDSILEKAYSQKRIRASTIISDDDIAYWQEKSVKIIKLCGDILRPSSLVVTKEDFNLYSATRPRLLERLRTTLETKTVLFLGYSLRDPFINQIWDISGYTFGRNRRQGIITLFDSSEFELRDLDRRGVSVVKFSEIGNRTKKLRDWLDSLISELKSPSASK